MGLVLLSISLSPYSNSNSSLRGGVINNKINAYLSCRGIQEISEETRIVVAYRCQNCAVKGVEDCVGFAQGG